MLIKYAQRSAKKHVEKGNGAVPKTTLPEHVNLEMSKSKSRQDPGKSEDLDSQFNLDALDAHNSEPLQLPSQKKKASVLE
jgi:hypothetical protein